MTKTSLVSYTVPSGVCIPFWASQRPLMTRSTELFPEPFSPTMRIFCPVLSLKDTSVEVHTCSRREGKYTKIKQRQKRHTQSEGRRCVIEANWRAVKQNCK